jgi:hypothetical protein
MKGNRHFPVFGLQLLQYLTDAGAFFHDGIIPPLGSWRKSASNRALASSALASECSEVKEASPPPGTKKPQKLATDRSRTSSAWGSLHLRETRPVKNLQFRQQRR